MNKRILAKKYKYQDRIKFYEQHPNTQRLKLIERKNYKWLKHHDLSKCHREALSSFEFAMFMCREKRGAKYKEYI